MDFIFSTYRAHGKKWSWEAAWRTKEAFGYSFGYFPFLKSHSNRQITDEGIHDAMFENKGITEQMVAYEKGWA